jgi:DNA-binding NtrC family response regulator
MSTAKAEIVESISKGRLRSLPTRERKAAPAARLEKIRDMASALLQEAESLNHENSLAEAAAAVANLNVRSGVDFFEEVRRFEISLIGRALELTGGNQARAARILGLGTTTLNYKIKAYEML